MNPKNDNFLQDNQDINFNNTLNLMYYLLIY